MKEYDHKKIEGKWQKKWQESGIYNVEEDPKKEKCYVLDMFPYPSGDGLHVGHPKGYIATDIYARYKKMKGFNVLHPMGWDAFGLPAENYALKNNVHPSIAVQKNVKRYKEQLSMLGFNYDWNREINTTDPAYYKWTQWIFLQMFKKGLAYESHEPINWCPSCKTGLANEDLVEGIYCERCGTLVEKKPVRQWVLKITDYAEKLLDGLDDLDWPDSIKESQRNWIGKSEGAEIEFEISDTDKKIKVFTTRPDTLFGATYMVLAPEHALVDELKDKIENWDEVQSYRKEVEKKTDIERTAEGKEKTGILLVGVGAINPANNEPVPIFIADYVLAHYGTGAIMAVPAHDQRDFDFAQQFGLDIKPVIDPGSKFFLKDVWVPGRKIAQWDEEETTKDAEEKNNARLRELILDGDACYWGLGKVINSGAFDGLDSEEAKTVITEAVGGTMKTMYKLRDWVFSRQRYWGEPIPLIHCEKCGVVPVPEEELPVKLPDVKSYEPTGTGESPLASIDEWVNVDCPTCGGAGKRETNTMPQWAGSCWYYLRYIDVNNKDVFVDKEKEKHWSPVDMYVGGAEHATRHLIYARFWHKFLYDEGYVSFSEPFKRLQHVGLINAEDGRKMSKRYNNVVNPDEVVERFGADTLRVYEMFMGPFDQAIAWSTDNMVGSKRFLEKVWRLQGIVSDDAENMDNLLHKTIKKVGEDIEKFSFNTAISTLMVLVNAYEKEGSISKEDFATLLILIAPFAPHMADELWGELGHSESIYLVEWPTYDEEKIKDDTVTLAVQVNGKVRDNITVPSDISEEDIKEQTLALPNTQKWIDGKEIKKFIYIKGKIVNIVV